MREAQAKVGQTQIRRNFYLPTEERPVQFRGYNLRVWPGYASRVDQYSGGLLAVIDPDFVVLRSDTVLDGINRHKPPNWNPSPEEFRRVCGAISNVSLSCSLLRRIISKTGSCIFWTLPFLWQEFSGISVFCRHNNQTYRIDDVDMSKNAMDRFDKDGTPTTFVDYYQSRLEPKI